MAGALIRSLIIHKNSIILWRVWEKDGQRGIDLGIIASLIMGAVVAVLADGSPSSAFSWAISGSLLFEELVKSKSHSLGGDEKNVK
jgi:hypothetical protein